MTDQQKIAQWITSDLHNNAPIYVDILKKVIPLYGSITSDDIHYRIEKVDKKSGMLTLDSKNLDYEYLEVFVTDKCYRPEYKHSMENLLSVINTDKIQPSSSSYHFMPNKHYFNNTSSSPYNSTIFSYSYIMMHVRELKLNTILSSSSSKDDVKNIIEKNSPEYLSTLPTIEPSNPSNISNDFT